MVARSAKDIWEAAKGALQIQVNKANYETWLKDTIGISYQGNLFVIGTPNTFASEWLEKRLQSLVRKTLIRIIGENVDVHFQVCPTPGQIIDRQEDILQTTDALKPPYRGKCPSFKPNPKYTFDTFVVGHCNRLAYAAALSVAEDPVHRYNPLFIYGGPGLGKTHLALAIGNVAFENGGKVLYTSAEQFTNEFVNGIREKKTEEFRHKFRNVDILLIDDIHFIAGKPQTQEGLFHTFNELHNAGRQLVITCDRAPMSLTSLESRLSSRFEMGLIASIQFPDMDTRLAILKAKADQLSIHLDKAIFELIAQRCQQNIRQLEGSLNRLTAYAQLSGKPPTLELAKKVLQDVTEQSVSTHKLTPDLIFATVAAYFNLSADSLKSKKRDQKTALARHISAYLIRENTNCSLQAIGNMLGGRDHTTVLHAYQKIDAQLKTDADLQGEVDKIVQKLQTSKSP